MAESVGRDSLYVDGLDTNFCCSVSRNFHQYTVGSKPALLQLPLNHSVRRIILVLSGSFRVGRSLNRQSHPSSG